MKTNQRPNIFTYEDYRKYLKDWYEWMKSTKPGFSYRAFSRWVGFKSPNQLLLVIQGRRNITINTLGKYFEILKLKHTERKYFELLVKFNQAQDMPTKSEYFREISLYWLKKGTMLEKEQLNYLSNWYYTAIREMVNLKGFREQGAWIVKQLGGLVTIPQARKALEILKELGLVTKDSDGKLKQTSNYVTTGDQVESVAAFLYHEQMIRLAMESLREKTSTERNLTALTFTMKKEDYENIVGEINDFRKRIIAALQNRPVQTEDTDLYQLNIHLFPIRKG